MRKLKKNRGWGLRQECAWCVESRPRSVPSQGRMAGGEVGESTGADCRGLCGASGRLPTLSEVGVLGVF